MRSECRGGASWIKGKMTSERKGMIFERVISGPQVHKMASKAKSKRYPTFVDFVLGKVSY